MQCMKATISYPNITLTARIIASFICFLSFSSLADNLHGKRFCEIILVNSSVMEIYSTIHVNDCPSSTWNKLNAKEIKKQTGSMYVFLNGPQKLIADDSRHETLNETSKTFQNLTLHKIGYISLSFRETIHGSRPYFEHYVERNTTWVYHSGTRIYELIDPERHVFVMKSFKILPGIENEQDLVNLEKKLQLPKGWRFKTGILQQDIDLVGIHKTAIVIQDNLKNTYQRANKDFLS